MHCSDCCGGVWWRGAGTHLFAFTADCVLNAIALAPGPARGRLVPVAGTAGRCGSQDGPGAATNPAARPTLPGYQVAAIPDPTCSFPFGAL